MPVDYEKINQLKRDRLSDDGGLLELPPESVSLAKFERHGDAIRRKDPIAFAAIQRNILQTFVQSQMIDGTDYGRVPQVPKPFLFKQGAEKLLTNLQRYLTELRSQQSERLQINVDMVLRELAIIGFGSIGDVLEIDDSGARLKPQLTEEARAAIGSITITDDRIQVRMHNKIQALRELGLHFGLFNDFNTAIATLKQYGTVEATETGHVFIQCI
jgi:hypothetical protein